MLKPFLEMRKIDVQPYCEQRKAKDENKREVLISYLPWVKCLVLLYENGAENVEYRPLEAPDGSYLFRGEKVTQKERINGCYFVKVEVTIDGKTYLMPYPVMNGTAVVYEDTLNQLRVSNAIQRAFVKCVAVNTGLGISLWEKDDETTDHGNTFDDPFQHNPLMVKRALEQLMTAKLQRTGASITELYKKLGIKDSAYQMIEKGLDGAAYLLNKLQSV